MSASSMAWWQYAHQPRSPVAGNVPDCGMMPPASGLVPPARQVAARVPHPFGAACTGLRPIIGAAPALHFHDQAGGAANLRAGGAPCCAVGDEPQDALVAPAARHPLRLQFAMESQRLAVIRLAVPATVIRCS
jgi:hypothetical protein